MSNDREHRIRDRAYTLWEQDGARHGHHDEHWLQATREIDAATTRTSGDKSKANAKSRAPAKPKAATATAAQKPSGRVKRKSS